jgi:hypothetical protein
VRNYPLPESKWENSKVVKTKGYVKPKANSQNNEGGGKGYGGSGKYVSNGRISSLNFIRKRKKPNIIKYKEKVSDNELNEAINEEHVHAMEA